MQRFFVKEDAIVGDSVYIKGDDAYHIGRSLRMKRGEMIEVCPSDSVVLLCELTSFTDSLVVAKVIESSAALSEPPCKIHIYQALPKGDKLETVVQKSVECGACSVTPFVSERCIAKAGDNFGKKLERYNRIALEAAKQSGRASVPVVRPLLTYEQMLKEAARCDIPLFCYEADGTAPLGRLLKRDVNDISVVIGSEGGFSENEALRAKENGMLLSGLGKRILRTETASTFVLSCLALYYELDI